MTAQDWPSRWPFEGFQGQESGPKPLSFPTASRQGYHFVISSWLGIGQIKILNLESSRWISCWRSAKIWRHASARAWGTKMATSSTPNADLAGACDTTRS